MNPFKKNTPLKAAERQPRRTLRQPQEKLPKDDKKQKKGEFTEGSKKKRKDLIPKIDRNLLKKERERERRAKIKSNPNIYAAYLEKERLRKKKTSKFVKDMTPREVRAQRKKKREQQRRRRERIKASLTESPCEQSPIAMEHDVLLASPDEQATSRYSCFLTWAYCMHFNLCSYSFYNFFSAQWIPLIHRKADKKKSRRTKEEEK